MAANNAGSVLSYIKPSFLPLHPLPLSSLLLFFFYLTYFASSLPLLPSSYLSLLSLHLLLRNFQPPCLTVSLLCLKRGSKKTDSGKHLRAWGKSRIYSQTRSKSNRKWWDVKCFSTEYNQTLSDRRQRKKALDVRQFWLWLLIYQRIRMSELSLNCDQ